MQAFYLFNIIARYEKKTLLLVTAIVIGTATGMLGQLPAPNEGGVSVGHQIIRATNAEAANKFWAALGAEPTSVGTIKLLKVPGELFIIGGPRGNAPATPIPGTHGTTVEFLTFKVKDLKTSLAQLKAAGYEPMADYKETTILGADGLQVRLTEDPKLATSVAADGLVMNVANAAEVSEWYAKWFGARISHSGNETIGDIPGSRIAFHETREPIAPTKGHSLALLGFEVKDLQDFVKRYQESGAKLDGNVATNAAANLSVVQLTDPWGTSIEVSQGLAAAK